MRRNASSKHNHVFKPVINLQHAHTCLVSMFECNVLVCVKLSLFIYNIELLRYVTYIIHFPDVNKDLFKQNRLEPLYIVHWSRAARRNFPGL